MYRLNKGSNTCVSGNSKIMLAANFLKEECSNYPVKSTIKPVLWQVAPDCSSKLIELIKNWVHLGIKNFLSGK